MKTKFKTNYLQMLNTYKFVNQWTLPETIDATWHLITDYKLWGYWLGDIVTIETQPNQWCLKKGSIFKTNWKGPLPYSLKLEVEITSVLACSKFSVKTIGDLNGVGAVYFNQLNDFTEITLFWHAQPTRLWMKALAPFAKWFFIYSHNRILNKGFDNFTTYLNQKKHG